MIAGVSEEGEPYVNSTDTIGAPSENEPWVAAGKKRLKCSKRISVFHLSLILSSSNPDLHPRARYFLNFLILKETEYVMIDVNMKNSWLRSLFFFFR